MLLGLLLFFFNWEEERAITKTTGLKERGIGGLGQKTSTVLDVEREQSWRGWGSNWERVCLPACPGYLALPCPCCAVAASGHVPSLRSRSCTSPRNAAQMPPAGKGEQQKAGASGQLCCSFPQSVLPEAPLKPAH